MLKYKVNHKKKRLLLSSNSTRRAHPANTHQIVALIGNDFPYMSIDVFSALLLL